MYLSKCSNLVEMGTELKSTPAAKGLLVICCSYVGFWCSDKKRAKCVSEDISVTTVYRSAAKKKERKRTNPAIQVLGFVRLGPVFLMWELYMDGMKGSDDSWDVTLNFELIICIYKFLPHQFFFPMFAETLFGTIVFLSLNKQTNCTKMKLFYVCYTNNGSFTGN